jgi:hypothetical protein
MVADETVVETAASAAHELVFSRLKASAVEDLDITVRFEDDILIVDVNIFAPSSNADIAQIADDAALAAQAAVDSLFAENGDPPTDG